MQPARRTDKSARRTPRIVIQPEGKVAISGSRVSFTAKASGYPTLKREWEVSNDSGRRWQVRPYSNVDVLSFVAQMRDSGDMFRAVFKNRFGRVASRAVRLTVVSPFVVTVLPPAPLPAPTVTPPPPEQQATPTSIAPSITAQPANTSATAGSLVSFSAAASGSPTPSVAWQVSENGGASFVPLSGSTSTLLAFTAQTRDNGFEFEAVFTNSAGSVTSNPATITIASSIDQSSNWAGYADTGATFTAVSAKWTVPTVTCAANETSYSSVWVGIDGALTSSSTVEQDGTEADCLNGVPTYDAWYEMYGDNALNNGYSNELNSTSYPVAPGDAMSASVSVVGSNWTLAVSDQTAGWSFSTVVPYSGASESSAEWIIERPVVNGSLTPLTDFGSVTVSDTSATGNGAAGPISQFTSSAIEMDGNSVLANPGSLQGAGTQFVTDWEASS